MNLLPNAGGRGVLTAKEIYSQPDAWRHSLDVINNVSDSIYNFMHKTNYEQIIFTGCGSTYYLSLSAAAVFNHLTGMQAIGLPASEVWLYSASNYSKKAKKLLVAISRSGSTTETINACVSFKDHGGGDLLTLSCYEDQPLAKMGDMNIVVPSGQEQSIAQTRAFTSLYLSTIAIAAIYSGAKDVLVNLKETPEECNRLLNRHTEQIIKVGTNVSFDRYYFLGSGIRYGLACELSLKMKEMSLSHSEAFHFFEFRHGPKSMVTDTTLIVGLLSGENHLWESDVIYEMQEIGAHSLTIGEGSSDIGFATQLDPIATSVLYLPLGQVLAFNRSIANGLNPDLPKNLDAVVYMMSKKEQKNRI